MTYEEALAAIIANRTNKALNYCVNYAIAGQGMTGHEAKTQCLYILNNMTHWRGDDATAVRIALKQAAGIKTAAKK
jgi:hypothetical protein